MNLLQQTKKLCKIYNIKPARSKGQNFLIKEDIYKKIIESADLKKDDVVLEVGPGLGFLTSRLAEKVKKVVAVELDDKLAEVLKTGLMAQGVKSRRPQGGVGIPTHTSGNVEVVNENVLDLRLKIKDLRIKEAKLPVGSLASYKIVANLPYNITSQFLRKFLSNDIKPNLMVLMLQKEVAERIVAKPGKMSLLSVSVQFYAKPEIIQVVSKDNFWPKPEVDSAIVRIFPHPLPAQAGRPLPRFLPSPRLDSGQARERGVKEEPKEGVKIAPFSRNIRSGRKVGREGQEKEFFRLAKIGFSAKRKMLKNNLANGYHISQVEAENKLKRTGFSEKIRAQELSVNDWVKLLGEFY